jgi:hypothetical protein
LQPAIQWSIHARLQLVLKGGRVNRVSQVGQCRAPKVAVTRQGTILALFGDFNLGILGKGW